jgi:DNA-directed RNA polymerase-3 subunit RPC5
MRRATTQALSETVSPNRQSSGVSLSQLDSGALHLHPVSKVMQFRTSLAYIDEIDVKNRERAGRKRGGDDDDEEESKPRAAAPAVPIRPGARKVSLKPTMIESRTSRACSSLV